MKNYTKKQRIELYQKLIDAKGKESVNLKVIEEYSELITEMAKVLNNYEKDGNLKLIDELSDAFIMTEQKLLMLNGKVILDDVYSIKFTTLTIVMNKLIRSLLNINYDDCLNLYKHLSYFITKYDAESRVRYKAKRLDDRLREGKV